MRSDPSTGELLDRKGGGYGVDGAEHCSAEVELSVEARSSSNGVWRAGSCSEVEVEVEAEREYLYSVRLLILQNRSRGGGDNVKPGSLLLSETPMLVALVMALPSTLGIGAARRPGVFSLGE